MWHRGLHRQAAGGADPLEGLHRLEYRGYDSAGIAIGNKGTLRVAKRQGRVRDLEELRPQRFKGTLGLCPHALGDQRRAERP